MKYIICRPVLAAVRSRHASGPSRRRRQRSGWQRQRRAGAADPDVDGGGGLERRVGGPLTALPATRWRVPRAVVTPRPAIPRNPARVPRPTTSLDSRRCELLRLDAHAGARRSGRRTAHEATHAPIVLRAAVAQPREVKGSVGVGSPPGSAHPSRCIHLSKQHSQLSPSSPHALRSNSRPRRLTCRTAACVCTVLVYVAACVYV